MKLQRFLIAWASIAAVWAGGQCVGTAAAQTAPGSSAGTGPAATGRGRVGPLVSPEVHADGTVTLRLRSANATTVTATGEMGSLKLTKDEQNLWSVTTEPLPPAIYSYSFVVNGVRVPDGNNPDLKNATESLVTVPGEPAMPWELRNVPHGTIAQVQYQSAAFNAQRRYFVYTPPGYQSGAEKLPVLYLLHGYTEDDSAWTAVGKAHLIADNLLADGKIKPLMIVMPYGQLNSRVNANDALGADFQEKFEAQIFKEIMPATEKNYRAATDARHRAMAGLSMGGMQAARIGMNHPEIFASIGMWSSATFGEPGQLLARLVASSEEIRHSFRYVQIGVGDEDLIQVGSTLLDQYLKGLKVPHDYMVIPGGHTWLVWRNELVDFLPKFSNVAQ